MNFCSSASIHLEKIVSLHAGHGQHQPYLKGAAILRHGLLPPKVQVKKFVRSRAAASGAAASGASYAARSFVAAEGSLEAAVTSLLDTHLSSSPPAWESAALASSAKLYGTFLVRSFSPVEFDCQQNDHADLVWYKTSSKQQIASNTHTKMRRSQYLKLSSAQWL